MSVPQVEMTELDGALGILPTSAGKLEAIAGDASAGPMNTPAAFASATAVRSNFGSGRIVEKACYAIEHYGKPVVLCRTAQNVTASFGTLDDSGVTGNTTVTLHAAAAADDDYEFVWITVDGGTVGTPGITFQWSLDGGRTLSPVTALGSAAFFAVPDSGSLRYDFTVATLAAGDTFSQSHKAPSWDNTALADALDALKASKQPWEYVTILGDADGSAVDTAETKLEAMHNNGKHRWALMHFRAPDDGENDADYQTAFDTAMSSHKTVNVDVSAGAANVLSSVSFRQYRRPIIFGYADRYAAVSEEQDISAIAFGPLPGVQIRDGNGNVIEHDEAESPGLDDLGVTTLRTWDNRDGVFVTNPRIFCPTGSDFIFAQFRRVMNIGRTALQAYLETRLSLPIRVNRKTGFILESEARDIESGANNAMGTALLTRPKASAVSFVLSRTDNLLSTQTLNYTARIVPLGYPKTITGSIGFNNPALRVIQVG